MFTGTLGTNFKEISFEITIFLEENESDIVACKMGIILSQPQCVKEGIISMMNQNMLPNEQVTSNYLTTGHCSVQLISETMIYTCIWYIYIYISQRDRGELKTKQKEANKKTPEY